MSQLSEVATQVREDYLRRAEVGMSCSAHPSVPSAHFSIVFILKRKRRCSKSHAFPRGLAGGVGGSYFSHVTRTSNKNFHYIDS